MSCKCCNKRGLCPMSLGLALGLTSGIAVLIWSLWVIYYGPTPMMTEFHMAIPTLKGGAMHALMALIKGFLFGFFIALFYDLISCCCKCKCCKKSEGGCACCGGKPDEMGRPEGPK